MHSAIYRGKVVHTRFRPREHHLQYRVFSLLLDLDELPELSNTSRLFGYNRFAVFSFRDDDHGEPETSVSLKAWVLQQLASSGLNTRGMRVSVLCYPRILGFVFNPLTVYFCYRADGQLAVILYEVCNTFHERHTYIIPVHDDATDEVRQTCPKRLYVSPFMPMECDYHFHISPPEEQVKIRINETSNDGRLLYAAFEGNRETFNDRNLFAVLVAYPLMTLKVVLAIHWEALKLWWKGMRVFRHSPANQRIESSIAVKPQGGE